MPDMPVEEGLISVVMSTYNRNEGYLRESIESILNQTYSKFEFIIVDDGSDNGAKEIIGSYHDPRIRLLINEQNIGLTNSLNKGLDECRGEFIARMDDDDIALPERFEKQFAFMRENPDVIVCGTWIEIIDEKSESTGEFKRHIIEDMDTYRIYLLFGNTPIIFHPSAFFNRRMFLKYDIHYNPEHRYAQDYGLWVRCCKIGRCAILPEVLMKYRKHSGAISIAKNQAQKKVDYAIIQKQLDSLHLTLPDDMKKLHHQFLQNCYFMGERYNIELKQWLRAIIKANVRYRVYNHKKLKKLIWNRWRIICQIAVKEHPGFIKSVSIILSVTPRGFVYSMKSAVGRVYKRISNHAANKERM